MIELIFRGLLVWGLLLGSVQPALAAGWAKAVPRPTAVDEPTVVIGREDMAARKEKARPQAQVEPPAALAEVKLILQGPREPQRPGATVQVTVKVDNVSQTAARGLTVLLSFDEKWVQVAGKPAGARVEPGVVRWSGVDVVAGTSWQGEVHLKLATSYGVETTLRGQVKGESLYSASTGQMRVRTMDPPPVQVRVQPGESKTLTALAGRFMLEIPAKAVTEPLIIQLQWTQPKDNDPFYIHERLELTARTDKGEAVTRFPAHLRLTLRRRQKPPGVALPPRSLAEPLTGAPVFYWYDESKQMWVDIGGRYDAGSGELEVEIDHFSTLAPGETASWDDVDLPDLRVDAESLFAGNFQFRYPLAMPPGPHGFGPKLALTYDDEVANSAVRADYESPKWYNRQASIVGYGWRIDGLGAVTIDWSCDDVAVSGCVWLSLPGGSYKLKKEDATGQWRTEPESFLKVVSAPELGKEGQWKIMDGNGVMYVLGGSIFGSSQATAYFGTKDPANSTCGPWVYRYALSEVKDSFGNRWTVKYEREERDPEHECLYVKATYPIKVHMYAKDPQNGAEHLYGEVEFVKTAQRRDYKVYKWSAPFSQTRYANRLIDLIRVYSYSDVGEREHLYTYDLSYEYSTVHHGSECDVNSECIHSFLKQITYRAEYEKPGWVVSPPGDRVMDFEYWEEPVIFAAKFLKRISNRHGGELLLKRKMYDFGNQRYRWRLIAARTTDGQGHGVWWTYSYSGGAYDEDEFAGFATVDARLHQQTGNSSETPPAHGGSDVIGKTLYSFEQGLGSWPDDVLRGKLWRTDRYVDPGGNVYHRVVHTFEAVERVTGEVAWARLNKTVWHTDKGGDGWDKHCTTYRYETWLQGGNQYGRVTHAEERPDWCSSAPYRTTITQYAVKDDAANHIYIVRPAQVKVKDESGVCRSLTQYFYYGGDATEGSSEAGYGDPGNKGLLRRQRVATDRDGDCGSVSSWAETGYTYYADGNPKRVTQPPNHAGVRAWTETTWDSVHGAYPVQTTNNLGHTTTKSYDLALGVAETTTDANGVTNEFEYDGYGRLRKSWIEPQNKHSGDTRATEIIEYYEGTTSSGAACSASWCVHRQKLDEGGGDDYLESYTFMDGLGRVIQRQSEGENQPIVQDTWYEERGQAAKESVPYFGAGTLGVYQTPQSQPFTQYAYDGLGRVTMTTAPDGTQTKTYYQGYQTAVIDANQHMTQQEVDDWGRLVSSHQYMGTFSAVDWDAVAYATATYGYDILDRLTDVTDAGGAHTTIDYDLAGRKTGMDDPDMGTWQYRYDAAGNLIKQRDARNQAICFYYDALNRLVGKTYHANVGNLDTLPCSGSYTVSYSYDSTANGNKGVGRRTGMSDGSGSTTWEYDARGRVTRESKTIKKNASENMTFVTRWEYDALDRVKRMRYPGGANGEEGEWVQQFYNDQGLLKELDGDQDYANDMTYTALGQLASMAYKPWNSALTTLTYDYYDDPGEAKSFWLQRISSSDGKFDREYFYDNVGNVTQIKDYKFVNVDAGQAWSTTTKTYTFGYDALNRLTSGVTSNPNDHGYSYSYDYAPNGNFIKYRSNTNLNFGHPDSSFCGASSPARPHAQTHYNSEKYCYDKNGNQVKRKLGADTWDLTYDGENRLTELKKNNVVVAQFWYDSDGKRVKAMVGGTTTYYVGKHYEYSTGSACSGGACSTKYYFANGGLVSFRRTGYTANNGLRFVIRDHLNSTSLVMNGGGTALWADYFTPFGGWQHTWKKATTIPLQTPYRYTGQRHERDIKLYDYGARWYDNRRGRFIQPDTLVPDPGDPQSLNRYSYVGNSPVRYTDPSGHYEFEEDPNDPYVWRRDKPEKTLIRTAKPVVNWQETQEGDILLPAKVIFGGAVVTVAGEAVLVDLAVPVAQAGWLKLLEALGVACADGDCGNEVESAYGDLSRAEEFGVRTYRELYRFTKGTGLQRHHIIERRFADVGTLDINPNEMLSVAVTHEEHQVLTNLWRQAIGYNNSLNPLNTATASVQDIWGAAQSIYQNYPALLEAARRTLFGP